MKLKFQNILYVFLPFVLIYLVGGLLSIPSLLFKPGNDSVQKLIISVVAIPLIFISLYIFKIKFHNLYLRILVQIKRKKIFIPFFYSFMFGTIFLLLAVGLTYAFNGIKFMDFGSTIIRKEQILESAILVALISNLLICVLEELLFRGFLLNYLNQFFKSHWSILISALFFSVGHVNYSSIISFIIAFVGGIVIGFLYQKSKSLYAAIGLHFAYNLYNYTFTSALTSENELIARPFVFSYNQFYNFSFDTIDIFVVFAFLSMFLFLYYLFVRPIYSFAQ